VVIRSCYRCREPLNILILATRTQEGLLSFVFSCLHAICLSACESARGVRPRWDGNCLDDVIEPVGGRAGMSEAVSVAWSIGERSAGQ